ASHLDRREAIDGSDFVLNMVQIGGHEATLLDFEIPARYGLRQTIADTLGIGGIFRTLRTAPIMLALGNEMAELCPPNAWLLNYTNPMAMLCWLVYAGTPPQRAERRPVRGRESRARPGRGGTAAALERIRVADRARDGDRRAAGDLRERPQRRPDPEPARRRLRRGAVRRRPDRAPPYSGA